MIDCGYDVEIDVRYIDNSFYLGHDVPAYKVTTEWLFDRADKLWIHCKNLKALYILKGYTKFNYFYHDKDDFTLTSKGYVWTYPLKEICPDSVLVCPTIEQTKFYANKNITGICTDWPFLI